MYRRDFLKTAALVPSWKTGPTAAISDEIVRMMAVAPVPGAVIGVVQNGAPGWIHPIGVASVETRQPVQKDTLFCAASLTKQVTAYAAFALRSQGKLDFDRTLVSYVDDLPKARTVKIRHVLSHSSGFPNWRFEAGKDLTSDFEPGSKFQYSGEGFFYLQRILEEVTGKGFGRLIDDLVFRPLGMTSSALLWSPDMASRMAMPHDRRGTLRKLFPIRYYEAAAKKQILDLKYAEYSAITREMGNPALPDNMLPNAAASLITSAVDYAKFVAAAMKNSDIRKEQVALRSGVLGWGLGWGIEHVAGREYLWQWGDNGGYKNIMFAEPERGEAIFVFTNGDSGARVYDRIVTQACGHDHPALLWI